MSSLETALLAKERSVEFYTDPQIYSSFDLTDDFNKIIDCVEPRDPADVEHGEYKVVIQTAGGGAGEGTDSTLALTALEKEPVSFAAGVSRDHATRQTTVLNAHRRCLYVASIVPVLDEMSNPNDLTRDSAEHWAAFFRQEEVFQRNVGRVAAAARMQRDLLGENGNLQELVGELDGLYPDHANVRDVRGENTARVYTVNLHPHVGVDRNKKRADPKAGIAIQHIQGYHDSLAASVSDLSDARGLSGEERGLRFASMVLRAAGARTVITDAHRDEFTFLEVRPTRNAHGLQFVELDLA